MDDLALRMRCMVPTPNRHRQHLLMIMHSRMVSHMCKCSVIDCSPQADIDCTYSKYTCLSDSCTFHATVMCISDFCLTLLGIANRKVYHPAVNSK